MHKSKFLASCQAQRAPHSDSRVGLRRGGNSNKPTRFFVLYGLPPEHLQPPHHCRSSTLNGLINSPGSNTDKARQDTSFCTNADVAEPPPFPHFPNDIPHFRSATLTTIYFSSSVPSSLGSPLRSCGKLPPREGNPTDFVREMFWIPTTSEIPSFSCSFATTPHERKVCPPSITYIFQEK